MKLKWPLKLKRFAIDFAVMMLVLSALRPLLAPELGELAGYAVATGVAIAAMFLVDQTLPGDRFFFNNDDPADEDDRNE